MKGHGGQGSFPAVAVGRALFRSRYNIIDHVTKVLTVKRGDCRDLLQEVGQEEPEETVSDVSAG